MIFYFLIILILVYRSKYTAFNDSDIRLFFLYFPSLFVNVSFAFVVA